MINKYSAYNGLSPQINAIVTMNEEEERGQRMAEMKVQTMPVLYPQILVSMDFSHCCVLEAGQKNPQQRYLTTGP